MQSGGGDSLGLGPAPPSGGEARRSTIDWWRAHANPPFPRCSGPGARRSGLRMRRPRRTRRHGRDVHRRVVWHDHTGGCGLGDRDRSRRQRRMRAVAGGPCSVLGSARTARPRRRERGRRSTVRGERLGRRVRHRRRIDASSVFASNAITTRSQARSGAGATDSSASSGTARRRARRPRSAWRGSRAPERSRPAQRGPARSSGRGGSLAGASTCSSLEATESKRSPCASRTCQRRRR